MSQINASPDAVRKLASDLGKTIKNLKEISEKVGQARNVQNWNDSQGEQFKAVIDKIKVLTLAPIDTLKNAIPRLEKIAETLDKYKAVKF